MTELPLADAILRNALQVLRLSAGEEQRVDAIMAELARELKDLVATGALNAAQTREVNAVIRQAEEIIDLAYRRAGASVDTHALAVIVAEKTQEILQDAIPATVAIPANAVLLQLGKDVLIDGAPSSAWWAKQSDDLAFKFAAQVRQGIANGETQERIVARITGRRGEPGIMDVPRRNARALVHTSVLTAANRARLETFRKNGRLIKGVRWLATLDSRTCIQCFPAGTSVLPAGALKKAFRAQYRGQMIVVTTATGKQLRGTPNHPILTARGFLPLGELKEGDQVFDASFDNGRVVIGDENVGVPTDIAQVFDALNKPSLFDVSRISPTAVDFYGDGNGMDGEVDVVWADRHLRGDDITGIGKLLSDPPLGFVQDADSLVRFGLLDLLFRGKRETGLSTQDAASHLQGVIDGALGPSYHPGDQVWLNALIEQLDDPLSVPLNVYVTLASLKRRHDAVLLEQAGDGGARSVELDGESAGRFTFSVKADHVRCLMSEFVSCHVYTLETGLGIYTAEGLIVKNCMALDGQAWNLDGEKLKGTKVEFTAAPLHMGCRCVLSPIPKTFKEIGLNIPEPDDTGQRASKDGPVPGDMTFQAFLSRQSPAFVENVLGKRRAELFLAGKLTVRDLVSGTGRELTLDELKTR